MSAVRKGVIKARFLTGVYKLQSSRDVFSNRTVDPNCRLCQLEVEDIRQVVSRCPAFHSIRTFAISQFMNLVIDKSDTDVWNSHFREWYSFLRIIICLDNIRHMVSKLSGVIYSVEELSRDFYKIHTKRLF